MSHRRRTAPIRRPPRSVSSNGKAAGSASPLTWSAAAFVRLAADLAANRNVVLPAVTHARYVAHTQGSTILDVTNPTDNSSVTASPVTVTGTTAVGNTVYVSATNTDANSATTVVSAAAAADGSFSIDVPVTGGTSVLNIVAVSPDGGTAHVKRTILFDFVPGTLLLEVSDPDHDDNGPGNYADPTSSKFYAGAFDIQAFQVFDVGSGCWIFLDQDARPVGNVRESARCPASRHLRVSSAAAEPADTATGPSNASRNFQISLRRSRGTD